MLIYIAVKVIWISKNRENNQTLQRHQHKIELKFIREGSANHQTDHRYSYSIIILLPHLNILHHHTRVKLMFFNNSVQSMRPIIGKVLDVITQQQYYIPAGARHDAVNGVIR